MRAKYIKIIKKIYNSKKLKHYNKFRLTNFEKKVLKELIKIPLGKTTTYKNIAFKIGNPKAYRAVAKVLSKNPWPLILPCHRVIKNNQETGDYMFGSKTKKQLINLEKYLKKLIC